jgi:hypothetical protein
MVVTCPKIGDGTAENPYRPDTTAKKWHVIAERPTEFDIEVIEQ